MEGAYTSAVVTSVVQCTGSKRRILSGGGEQAVQVWHRTRRAQCSDHLSTACIRNLSACLPRRLSYASLQVPDLHWCIVRLAPLVPVYLGACFGDALATSDFCEDDVGDSRALLLRKKKNLPTEFLFHL